MCVAAALYVGCENVCEEELDANAGGVRRLLRK